MRACESEGQASGTTYLVELTFKAGLNAVKVLVKSRAGAGIAKMVAQGIAALLKA